MHNIKINLGDYAKKAGRLSMLQHGAYWLLMGACYDRERFPTEQEAIDWTWASNQDERDAVMFVLQRFFILQEDGTLVQKRIYEELQQYQSFCETQAAKGKKGGRPKNPTGKEKKPNGLKKKAEKSRVKPEKSLTNNLQPITDNQQPTTSIKYKTLTVFGVESLVTAAKEFIDHRKNMEAPLTQAAFNRFMSKVDQIADELMIPPSKIINLVIDAGWKSVELEWVIQRLKIKPA